MALRTVRRHAHSDISSQVVGIFGFAKIQVEFNAHIDPKRGKYKNKEPDHDCEVTRRCYVIATVVKIRKKIAQATVVGTGLKPVLTKIAP